MEGIKTVHQNGVTPTYVRIELEEGFYIVLNASGMTVGRSQPGVAAVPHAHLDGEAAGQIARTIQAWTFRKED